MIATPPNDQALGARRLNDGCDQFVTPFSQADRIGLLCLVNNFSRSDHKIASGSIHPNNPAYRSAHTTAPNSVNRWQLVGSKEEKINLALPLRRVQMISVPG